MRADMGEQGESIRQVSQARSQWLWILGFGVSAIGMFWLWLTQSPAHGLVLIDIPGLGVLTLTFLISTLVFVRGWLRPSRSAAMLVCAMLLNLVMGLVVRYWM